MTKSANSRHRSRRRFFQTLGIGALAAKVPVVLALDNKSGSKLPVLGQGEHTFEVHHDWGELPANIKYGNVHGVVEDSQGQIYVHHTVNVASESSDSMVVFDQNGKFVRSWGKEFKGGAHGLHLQKEGKDEFLYMCDTKRGVVVKATLKGEEVFTLGYPKESDQYKLDNEGKPATKYSPTNLAIAPNGDIYVGDGYGSNYINQYNKKGEFIRTFGGTGKEAGQLACPHGITVDTRGKTPVLTVADRSNQRLQLFTLDGKHLSFVNGFSHPCHFHERKGLFVIPDLFSHVTIVDRSNRVVADLGKMSSDGWKDLRKQTRDKFPVGGFVCPHGACFDHKGNIFVVEWVEVGRVTKLRKV